MIKLLTLLLFTAACSAKADIAYKFDLINDEHYAAELNSFQIQSTSKIKIIKLPSVNGIHWLDTDYSDIKRKVNGEDIPIYKARVKFFVEKEGFYKIPPVEAEIGDEVIYLKPERLRIMPVRAKAESFVKLLYNGKSDPGEFFVGQNVDIEILVFKTAGSKLSVANPTVNLENARLHKYRKQGLNFGMQKRSGIFYSFSSGISQSIKSKDFNGKKWDIKRYKITAQLMRSGRVNGEIVTILSENGRRYPIISKLDFFVNEIPKRDVNGAFDSMLSGEWKINARFSTDKIEAGKTFTYTVNFTGKGDLRRLKIPRLEIPGIKVVNSQFRKNEEFVNEWKGSLTYSLYPSKAAAQMPAVKMSFFNTESQKHETVVLNKARNVIGGSTAEETVQKYKLSPQDDSLGADVRKPLYLNISPWLLVLFFAMPVLYISLPMLRRLKACPETKKIKSLTKRRASLMKKCDSVNEELIPDLIKTEIIPFLIDAYRLPQGSTVEEIIPYIKCEKLKQLLVNFNSSCYSGSSMNLSAGSLSRVLKNLSIALFLYFCSTAAAGNADSVNDAFEKGLYGKAADSYLELLKERPNNASLHYNLGNAYFKNREFNRARASYHTALMLSPSHQGAKANLKLLNKETDYSGSPVNPLNILRPDQWISLFITVWAVLWLVIIVLKLRKIRLVETSIGGAVIIALLAFTVYFQITVSYADERYQVIAESVQCFDKPGSLSKEINNIPAGTEFLVLKESDSFVLVQSEGRHIWLKKKDLQKIW